MIASRNSGNDNSSWTGDFENMYNCVLVRMDENTELGQHAVLKFPNSEEATLFLLKWT
jgi:hypothetical protein